MLPGLLGEETARDIIEIDICDPHREENDRGRWHQLRASLTCPCLPGSTPGRIESGSVPCPVSSLEPVYPWTALESPSCGNGQCMGLAVGWVDPIPYDTPKPAGHTRFVCISDTHSRTDAIQMPYGDILLHTGDFTELGLPSEVKKFNDWLGNLPYEYKIVIAGNHELTFDKEFMADLVKQDYYRFPSVSKLKPEDFDNVQSLLTNSIYLQDSEVTVKGFRIYGAPWTPWFNGWGFNLPRGQSLLDKWNLVPEGVDILMTHGPPLGFRDWVPKELQRVGCVELLNTVQRRVRPKLHVFGGIHEGYGIMTDGYTTYINASTCTVSFQPTNPPIIFDLPNPQGS
ncbi:Metallophosphoesterase MPPED2 [Fukomys damarensis]|uniref:Metallophosphoesterase MPPED2 n=3 Tax=Fukomys damarensis TaxID=885580 RepID=A0A091D822_FUKDA|nr:Metallophosphoesterase MPPED2 [Fukomys damarensis]